MGEPRRPYLLLVGSAACFVVYLMLALQGSRLALDDSVRTWIHSLRDDAMTELMRTASIAGDGTGLIPMIGIASVTLWRATRHWALGLPLVMAGAGALQWLAKWAADRPRPDAAPWGYPSGHVLTVVVLFGAVAYLVTASGARRRWRLPALSTCAVAVTVVAFSRLYLDRHWLSDVVGGFAVGLAYLLLMIWLVDVALRRRLRGGQPVRAGR